MSSSKLITLICLLIININVGQIGSADYSYDEYEEISESLTPGSSSSTTTTTEKTPLNIDDDDKEDEERRRMENDVIKTQLDVMSNTFRKIINKIKMKPKIDMVFLVDSSSSVGKENFGNEISFVKRLLSDFNVSFNYTRVALITFSSRSKIVSKFLHVLNTK